MNRIVNQLCFINVLIVFLLISSVTFAQNLVKNPSFEQYNACPDQDTVDAVPLDWESYSTSKYVNSCALDSLSSVPKNRYAFQAAKDGLGYVVGIAAHKGNDRITYNRGKLTQPLKKDSIYCVSYYICAADELNNPIRNIDAYLSKNLTVNWNQSQNNILSQYSPQVRSRTIWNDTLNWTKVSELFKASGGEKYITIGNFTDDENTNNNDELIYYLLDKVSVSPVYLKAPLGIDITICPSEFPYTLKAPKGYDRYSWGADSLIIRGMGTYSLTCYLDNCGSISDELDIGLKIVTPLSLIKDTTICKGEQLLIEAQPGFNTYLWNTGDTTRSISISQPGIYSLEAERYCGIQKDSVLVFVDAVPEIDLSIGRDTNICKDEEENIPLTLTPNKKLPNYTWSTGDTSSTITVVSGGEYWLEAKYSCGKLRSNTIQVTACVPKKDIIFIPNAFSPNNDGLNDVFRPVVNDAKLIEMNIYNRWGEEVYSDTEQFAWDGICGLKACQKGIYIFVIIYKDEAGNVLQRNGKFQLVN